MSSVPLSLSFAAMAPAFYLAAAIGWPDVALALVASLPGLIAAIFAGINRWHLRTPSGARIGVVAEKTHDLAAVAAMKVDRVVNGQIEPPHGTTE